MKEKENRIVAAVLVKKGGMGFKSSIDLFRLGEEKKEGEEVKEDN